MILCACLVHHLLLEITDHAKIRATPFLLALATSANIGSVMTLTGNPQNVIIGHSSGWGWSAFALRMSPIGFVCLVANWVVLRILFRRELDIAAPDWQRPSTPPVSVERSLALKSVLVFFALVVAFLAGAPLDVAAISACAVLLVWANRPPRLALEAVDWQLLLFFAGLFVVVEGFVKADRYLLER